MMTGEWRKNRGESGTRPASVGGLQAPTNWIRSSVIQVRVDVLQNPPCSTSCRMNEITRCVPYVSGAGRLISSQKRTSQRPIWAGARIVLFMVFLYSQYCSNDFTTRSGVVALEKLIEATSKFGSFRRALNKVIVFPEPGGPQRMTGRCSDIQEYNTSS